MTLTKAETTRMLNIKHKIESWVGGNMKGMTAYRVDECIHVYNGILQTVEHSGLTIDRDVKAIFEKAGFKIMPKGIGYCISIR